VPPQIVPNGVVLDAGLLVAAGRAPAPTARPAFRATRSIRANAKLMENINTLSDMWEEYRHGHGNYIAASEFTRDKINGQGTAFKKKYSRRLKIWRLQSYLVNQGFDIGVASGMIANVYGTDKPTPLIVCIQREQNIQQWYPFIGSQRFNPRLVAGRGLVI
jgi:hypothetical protein